MDQHEKPQTIFKFSDTTVSVEATEIFKEWYHKLKKRPVLEE